MQDSNDHFQIELTTQNLHFHDNASIYSLSMHQNNILTAGGDKDIRLWSINHETKNDILSKFISNESHQSTVKINYEKTFSYHSKSVNCVRFCDKNKYFASCSDGGEVVVWKGDEKVVVKGKDEDDVYEVCWMNDFLIVGTSKGRLMLYLLEENLNKNEDEKIIDEIQVAVNINSQDNNEITNVNSQEFIQKTNLDIEELESIDKLNKIIEQDDDLILVKEKIKIIQEKENYNEEIENKENLCASNEFLIKETKISDIKNKQNILNQNFTDDVNCSILSSLPATINSEIDLEKKVKPRINKIKLKIENASFKFKQIQNIKIHSDIIQGIAFNKNYNIIATTSKDRSVKTFYFDQKLVFIDKIDNFNKEKCFADDVSKILFRRLNFSFCGKFLYLPAGIDSENKNYVYILHYPFRSLDFYGKIGPLEQPAIKIICTEKCNLIMCKKMVYYIENNTVKFFIKNVSFFPMTDCSFFDDVFYFSSLDGFLYTLKLKEL